jgi:SH3 domain
MTAVQQPLQLTSPTRTISTLTTTTTSSASTAPTTNSIISTSSTANTATRPRTNSTPANNVPLIVRALYDYHSPDSTNLSFQAGTLIRVLTQLQSGWWDGCIDGERGWFPCNFVTEVDGETLGEEEDFLDTNESISSSGDEDIGERALVEDDMLDEFSWVPQADKEGRTFFLNTQNGATSWELPTTKVFLDDWDEKALSDEDAGPRSSLDSENSGDILMLGPIHPESYVTTFNVRLPYKLTNRSDYPFNQLHQDLLLMQNPIQRDL